VRRQELTDVRHDRQDPPLREPTVGKYYGDKERKDVIDRIIEARMHGLQVKEQINCWYDDRKYTKRMGRAPIKKRIDKRQSINPGHTATQ